MKIKYENFKRKYDLNMAEYITMRDHKMKQFQENPYGNLSLGFSSLIGVLADMLVSEVISARIKGICIDGEFDLKDVARIVDGYIINGSTDADLHKVGVEGEWARNVHEAWGRASKFGQGPAERAIASARYDAISAEELERDRNSLWYITKGAKKMWRTIEGKYTTNKARAGVWAYENRPKLEGREFYHSEEVAS